MKKYKCVIFDLDGTLMDTSEGIYKSIDYTLEKYNLSFRNIDDRSTFIGPPIGKSFQSYFNVDDAQRDEMTQCFRDNYKDVNLCLAKIYDNTIELLAELKNLNIKTGVATYKRYDYANKILDDFKISSWFDDIQGSDFESKLTKKDILENCIKNLDVNFQDVLFVGDTLSDLEASKSLGVDFAAVMYGFGLKDDLNYVKENSVLIADSANDITKFINN